MAHYHHLLTHYHRLLTHFWPVFPFDQRRKYKRTKGERSQGL